MTLANGSRLGSYEILAPLGAGGMGEVYRARDTKLGRAVAVKVLPEAFAFDPERVTRFEREARLLASLNHPHIAALYGMEESGGQHFLVMELVEGETLADRLRRGPIPVEESLRLAHQIAEALEAAHEKGIIHRDLKPANVKTTQDGKAKVLDFGLGKLQPGGSGEAGGPSGFGAAAGRAGDAQGFGPVSPTQSPTLSLLATQAGVILGTAGYMSPEQAKGLPADHRSDVFSFGTVLYEMLSGRQPFHGDTAPDILASVLAREPDLTVLPPNLNPRLVELLRRCLEKDPKRRWQAVGDLRVEIETVAAAPFGPAATATLAAPPRHLLRRAMPVLAAAILAGSAVGLVTWISRPSSLPVPVTRFQFTLPEGQEFQSTALPLVAISPDGTQMVYSANQRPYLRSMSDLATRPIAGTEAPERGFMGGPVFSPDGQSVAFWTASSTDGLTLKRIALGGGVAVTLCQVSSIAGASWGRDGIVFGDEKGVMRVSANGGQPELLVGVKDGEIVQGPQVLPGGEAVLFTLVKGAAHTASQGTEIWDKATLVVQSLTSGERKTLFEGGSDARYLPTGHLVYAKGETLLAVPFDLKQKKVTGGPVPVVDGVRRGVFGTVTSGLAHFSVSNTGALVYVPVTAPASSGRRDLALVDRQGNVAPLNLPPRAYAFPRVSPDGGRQVVFATDAVNDANVWVYDLSGTQSARQLTFGGRNRFPIWSADGQRVAFQSDREGDLGIFWQRADGSTPAERLTKPGQGTAHIPESWSPDGNTLLLAVTRGATNALSILALPDKKETALAEELSSVNAFAAMFSPDGRSITYSRGQVFVQPFPITGAKYLISSGFHPAWSHDGKELFFVQYRGTQRREYDDAADIHIWQPRRRIPKADIQVSLTRGRGLKRGSVDRKQRAHRTVIRHHAGRQAVHRRRRDRASRIGCVRRAANPGRPQLARRAEAARAVALRVRQQPWRFSSTRVHSLRSPTRLTTITTACWRFCARSQPRSCSERPALRPVFPCCSLAMRLPQPPRFPVTAGHSPSTRVIRPACLPVDRPRAMRRQLRVRARTRANHLRSTIGSGN